MKHKIFKIPLENPDPATDTMNSFCSQRAVESIERHFVANGDDSFWTFCIKWNDGHSIGQNKPLKSHKKASIDYQQYFDDPDNFALFDELRKLRNSLAEQGGFPSYTIFTNAQLAELVEENITTKTELKKMEGFGKTKFDKYADLFIEKINAVNLQLGKHGGASS